MFTEITERQIFYKRWFWLASAGITRKLRKLDYVWTIKDNTLKIKVSCCFDYKDPLNYRRYYRKGASSSKEQREVTSKRLSKLLFAHRLLIDGFKIPEIPKEYNDPNYMG